MTAVWQRIAAWKPRRWPLNPVVIKELRQAVRSWFVTGILLLFLAVLLLVMLGYLASQTTYLSPEQGLGQEVFQVLVAILAGAGLIFIPLYTGVRLALERHETNLDLLYITTLSPGRIVRGKLMCGIYLTVLFFSACMPFIVLTNLLRGVDLPTIAWTLFLVFFCVCGAIQLAIFVACMPVSTPFKAILAIPFIGSMIALTTGLSSSSRYFMRSGMGFTPDEKWILLTIALIYLLAFGWFYLCSVALISPRSMNRAVPLRIYATLVWFLAGVVFIWEAFKYTRAYLVQIWFTSTLVIILVALVVIISEPDRLSLRVQRKIPAAPGKRWLAFFFFNGAAQGLAWILALTIGTVLATVGTMMADQYWMGSVFATASYGSIEVDAFRLCGAWCLYGFCYALTGLFLHRVIFPSRTPMLASIFSFMIPALWAVLPNFVMFLFNRLSWRAIEDRQLGNVFNVLLTNDPAQQQAHLGFAAGWAVLALLANVPWFIRQARAFKPLPRSQDTSPA
jgi:hypothetical protein